MRSSLIEALCRRQVFPCDPDNRVTTGDSRKVKTHTGLIVHAVEHLPVVSGWPRNSNQKRRRHRVCSDCGAVFKEKLQLIKHVKVEHGRNHFSCPCCERTFVSKGTYPVHSSESRQIPMRNLREGLRESHELCGSSGYLHRCQAKFLLSLPAAIYFQMQFKNTHVTLSSERIWYNVISK